MSLRIRRGSEAERTAVRFDQGEIVWVNSTTTGRPAYKLYVGDGVTLGGKDIVETSAGNKLTYNAVTGRLDVAGLTTDDIAPGVNNKFFTPELAQDAVAAMFSAGTKSGIQFVYDDVLNRMNVTVTATGGGGGGTGITAVVDDPSPELGGTLNLNNQNINGIGNIDIQGNITLVDGSTNRSTTITDAVRTGTTPSSSFTVASATGIQTGDTFTNLPGGDAGVDTLTVTEVVGNVVSFTPSQTFTSNLTLPYAITFTTAGSGGGNISTIGTISATAGLGSNLALNGNTITGNGTIDINGDILLTGRLTAGGGLDADLGLNGNSITGDGSININGSIITGTGLGDDLSLNSYNINGVGSIDIDGNIVATQFSGDIIGSVFSDGNIAIVDITESTITAQKIVAQNSLSTDSISDISGLGVAVYAKQATSFDFSVFKGTTESQTTTVAGEHLGAISIKGYNGTTYPPAGSLIAAWDATAIVADDYPKSNVSIIAGAGGENVVLATLSGATGVFSVPVLKVSDVAGTLPSSPQAGMIVLDGTTFKGYNGSSWVNLN